MMTSPPLPPSPPEGPPRGTNFSRRNARQPLPPSPAFTRIIASSMNMDAESQAGTDPAQNHIQYIGQSRRRSGPLKGRNEAVPEMERGPGRRRINGSVQKLARHAPAQSTGFDG